MSTTRIYAPAGAVGRAGTPLAPLPAPLAGRRIVALDNGKPGADRLLSELGQRLATRTRARFVRTVRKGSAATACEQALFDEIVAGADIVVTGTAD